MKALSDNICIGLDASNIKSGGGITHLLNLLRSSDPRKHGITKVVVWAGKNTLSLLPRYDWLRSVSTDYIDMSLPFRTWWQQMLLPGCLTREGCDLLFSPGGLSPRRLSVPVVTMSQNLLPFDPHEMARYGLSPVGIRLRLLRRLQEESFKKSDGVIFLTHYAAKTVQSCIRGDIHGKIGIIPHGVEHIFYNEPRPVSPVSFINDFNSFRLLYVSIVNMYKHQWNVVEAVGRLRTKGLPLTVDFVGSAYPPALRLLERAIRKYDPVGEWARYKGPASHAQIHLDYQAADAFVFASSCENLPNILLEAMAAGLPIACSNHGPMPEVLGDDGFYFNPERPEEISSAIEALYANPMRRLRKAMGAYRKATTYSWERCADETFSFLADIARRSA